MPRLTLTMLIALSAPLSAQRVDDARVALQPEAREVATTQAITMPVTRTNASTGSMVLGGIVGGAMGAFFGASVGKSIQNCGPSDGQSCGVAGSVIGGLIGESIGVPTGVSWVSDGSGSLTRSIRSSMGVAIVGLAMGFATGGASVLAIPPIQLYTSIRTERTGTSGFMGW